METNDLLSLLIIMELATNSLDQEFGDIQIDEENITEIESVFGNIMNLIQEQSTENFINQSILRGINIDAYNGLSSRFNYFIRGAIIPENENDERNLDKINEKLMELEKIDRNNIPEIIKIFASIINNIFSLSVETKHDMLRAFIKQNAIEEKMNESFPQVGTIMFHAANMKENKTLFSKEDIQILSEITKDIKLLEQKETTGKLTNDMIVNHLHNSLFKATVYAQEIFLKIVENNPQYFKNIENKTGINFDNIINRYQLPIQSKRII